MDFSFQQGLAVAITIVVVLLCVVSFGVFLSTASDNLDKSIEVAPIDVNVGNGVGLESASKPRLVIEPSIVIPWGCGKAKMDSILKSSVKAYDGDVDISNKVVITHNINYSYLGSYKVKFSVTNSKGISTSIIRQVLVKNIY